MKYTWLGLAGFTGAIAIQQLRFVFPWLSEFGLVFNLLCLAGIVFTGLFLGFQVWSQSDGKVEASNFMGTGFVLVGMVGVLVLTQEVGRWLAS